MTYLINPYTFSNFKHAIDSKTHLLNDALFNYVITYVGSNRDVLLIRNSLCIKSISTHISIFRES